MPGKLRFQLLTRQDIAFNLQGRSPTPVMAVGVGLHLDPNIGTIEVRRVLCHPACRHSAPTSLGISGGASADQPGQLSSSV